MNQYTILKLALTCYGQCRYLRYNFIPEFGDYTEVINNSSLLNRLELHSHTV